MLLEISDITPLKNFFDIIYDSVNIVEMKLDQDKLAISLLNNSHIAFYNLEISKEFFLDYSINDVESILVFVEDFYKILKSSSKDDCLILETTESNLICTFERNTGRRVFELPLAEDYADTPIPPSIDYKGECTVLLKDLKEPVSDLDKIVKTDRFKIIVQNNTLNVVAPSDSMTGYNLSINVEDTSDGYVIVNVAYIDQLLKLSKINDEVVFNYGDGIPLSWNITSHDELVKVSGIIAPIIEDE